MGIGIPIQMYPLVRLPVGWVPGNPKISSDGNLLFNQTATTLTDLSSLTSTAVTMPSAAAVLAGTGGAFKSESLPISNSAPWGGIGYPVVAAWGGALDYSICYQTQDLAPTLKAAASAGSGSPFLSAAMMTRVVNGGFLFDPPMGINSWNAFVEAGFNFQKVATVASSAPCSSIALADGSRRLIASTFAGSTLVSNRQVFEGVHSAPDVRLGSWSMVANAPIQIAYNLWGWGTLGQMPAGSVAADQETAKYATLPAINGAICNYWDAQSIYDTAAASPVAVAVGLVVDMLAAQTMAMQTNENSGAFNLRPVFGGASTPIQFTPTKMVSGFWGAGATWPAVGGVPNVAPITGLADQWSRPWVAGYLLGGSPSIAGGLYYWPQTPTNPGRLNPTVYSGITFAAQNPILLWLSPGGAILGIYIDNAGNYWVAIGGSITTFLSSLMNYGRYISTAVNPNGATS